MSMQLPVHLDNQQVRFYFRPITAKPRFTPEQIAKMSKPRPKVFANGVLYRSVWKACVEHGIDGLGIQKRIHRELQENGVTVYGNVAFNYEQQFLDEKYSEA